MKMPGGVVLGGKKPDCTVLVGVELRWNELELIGRSAGAGLPGT
jgi:hypothetical protein